MGIRVHAVAAARGDVFDKAETERASAVLVSLELRNGRVGCFGRIETNNTSTTGPAAGLVLNLGLLNLANGSEQLDEIFVAGRPGKLTKLLAYAEGKARGSQVLEEEEILTLRT